jgi:hypothetical protein
MQPVTEMEAPAVLERLRLAGVGDAHGAVGFVLQCFMEEALAGGADAGVSVGGTRERAGVVETVTYACGVQLQTVPMGGSLVVHVLKPGCAPLHWVLRIADFVPTWGTIDAAEGLDAPGLAGLRQAFDEHIGEILLGAGSLSDLTAADTTATPVPPPQAAAPKIAAAEAEARARSFLEDPIEPTPEVPSWWEDAPAGRPGGIHMPGAGLLGGRAPPPGGAGGMLIGPGHPGFGVEIGPGGGGMPPAQGPDGAPVPGARWDPIHGQGGLGDPDQDGDADLHRPPSGIDDADVDSMFM